MLNFRFALYALVAATFSVHVSGCTWSADRDDTAALDSVPTLSVSVQRGEPQADGTRPIIGYACGSETLRTLTKIAYALPIHLTDTKYYSYYLPEKYKVGVDQLMKQGQVFLNEKKVDKALKVYEQAAAKEPTKVGPIVGQAVARKFEGKADLAQKLFERALKMPGIRYDLYITSVLELGMIHGCKGDHAKATEIFLQGLARDPTHVRLNRNIGVAYAAMGRRSKTIMHWSLSLSMDPTQTKLRRDLFNLMGP